MDMQSYTMREFLSESNLTKPLARKIVGNLYEKMRAKMVFNLTQLDFYFDCSTVVLSYYVANSRYPTVMLSSEQMEKVLTRYLVK